ncbi:Sas10/Utp3/C1D [Kalmanozyma brasiliensis GHG001]|uniref:Sas10 C-terminal domain-containing protein n=1 Tax=Kalmanozyma brasiliensis (strain GHG001) TaxID=1365824 RepID=V5EME7_KALBG|nr:Sas10/Utp3/C1D [Kalmanozyma brasiliensis GHG001]EST06310.1 Sas10/Utp3/C1D [Kalmanozyma brasiliensis GHG001]
MAGRRSPKGRRSGDPSLSRSAGFDDIPRDDEDLFEASRDQILLDGQDRGIDSDDDMDVGLNDREVLGIDEARSDEDEDADLDDDEDAEAYDEDEAYPSQGRRGIKKADIVVSSDDDDLDDDEEDDEDAEDGQELHENDRGWGANKRAYYNTNDLDAMDSDSDIDEEQARELELKEVKRLQKKSRSAMDDSDFGLGGDDVDSELVKSAQDAGREQRRRELDGDDSITASPRSKKAAAFPSKSNGVTTQANDEASRRARLAKLQQSSPEAVALAGEYADMLEDFGRADALLKKMMVEQPKNASLEVMHVHYQTLATYITTMTFYFHLRATAEFANDPAKLRAHPVMQRMMCLKQGLSVMEDLGLTFDGQRTPGTNGGLSSDEMDEMNMLSQGSEDDDLGDLDEDELADLMADAGGKENAAPVKVGKKKSNKQEYDDKDYEEATSKPKPKKKAAADKPKKKATKAKKPEPVAPLAAGLADLNDEPVLQVKLKKKGSAGSSATSNPFAVSDNATNFDDATFGEMSGLSSIDSAERAARKRSLQFHASAIESKALQRSKAAKERQSGDADIPYRDRERSRAGVEATKAAREAKLQQQLNGGMGKDVALDGQDGWGQADEKDWRDVMGQSSASSSRLSGSANDDDGDDDAADYYDLVTSSRKRARAEAKEEYDEARNAERFALMEDDVLEDGQHRGINRQIEKNKGLTPHRPKTSRNPRVRKRLKYEQAKKKLGSRQAVFKGGQSSLQGGYGGEASGISTHLVKSRKLG